MEVSLTEARHALSDVEETTTRSNQSRAYRNAAPHLILWGAILVVGYGALSMPALFPTGWMWVILDIVGLIGSGLIAGRTRTRTGGQIWRRLAAFATIFLFVATTLLMMHPTQPAQYYVFPPLVVGLIYGLIGVFTLPKLLLVSALISVSSVVAFYYLQPWLPLCIAVTGGGGLIVGGLWMRRL